MKRSTRRLLLLLLSMPLILAILAAIYQLLMAGLEGQPRDFWSALEWAAETITTVGYGRDAEWDHPLTVLFVIAVQLSGVVLIFLIVPVYLIPFLEERFEARPPTRQPALRKHVVIWQHGPAVVTLLEELKRRGVASLVIEPDRDRARRLVAAHERVLCRRLDDDALAAAHLLDARALIVNASDEENVSIILGARELGFEGEVLALVEEPVHRRPLALAGANAVFTPRHVLAAVLAGRASHQVHPRVEGGFELGHLEVREFRVQPTSELVGRTLAEAEVGSRTGATVIGQWRAGRLETLPPARSTIARRAVLIAIGTEEGLNRLAELAGEGTPVRTGPVVVAGLGEVGSKVVELLREAGEPVRVLDRVAGPGVDVVGDAVDHIEDLGVADARAVVLALDSDAATLFATVVVRDVSSEVPIIARVNQAQNVHRIHRAGADFALSISQVAGQILAHRLLGDEILNIDPQLRVLKESGARFAGRRLGDLDLRERTGCSIVAIERDGAPLATIESELVLAEDDVLYVCGGDEGIDRFKQLGA